MFRKVVLLFLAIVFAPAVFSQNNVVTQEYDLGRTGWYNKETVLNTQNVRPGLFGKLFSRNVDDQIYAQPLVMQVNLPSVGKKNIVIVATVKNSVYAFDADSANIAQPYWYVNLTPPGYRVPNRSDMVGACGGNYYDFAYNIGIVGTPVIDPNSLTLYVVARSVNASNQYFQYLHALDIITGQEKANSPVLITATINGNGDGNVNGVITFNAQHQNQRPGLLLSDNKVYITWASHCDWSPYHGWIIGYDATTLQQVTVYNTTPEGYNGGIWMSGSAPSADEGGNIYVGVGNGSAGKNGDISNITNVAECVLKLKTNGTSLSVSSFFTPSDYLELEASDLDVGITNQLLLPNSNRLVAGSKEGKLFLLNRDSMGGYNTNSNKVLQEVNLGLNAHMHSNLSYYKGSQKEWVYTWSENSLLKAFNYDRNAKLFNLNNTISSSAQGPIGGSGAFLSISSNGSVDSTAILWASHAASGDASATTRPGVLRAFDANDITNELWNTSIDSADNLGNFAKFNPPVIANGKVYIGTFSNQLLVYGVRKNADASCNSDNFGLNKTGSASSSIDGGSIANAFDGDSSTFWNSASGDNQWISVDLNQRYDLCGIKILWGAQSSNAGFSLQVSDDNQNWKTMINVTGKIPSVRVNGSGRFVRILGAEGNNSYSIAEFEVFGSLSVAQCTLPFLLPVTNVYGNSVTINWSSIGDNFVVQYKTVSASNWNEITTSTTSLTINALACSTDFLYRVLNVCNEDSSTFSSGAFSTIACDPNCGRLPTRWSSLDIGNVLAAGEACFNAGIFTMHGSGSDVWNDEDQFRYAYKTFNGDGELLARVVTMDSTNIRNKCGVMFRETLAAGSRHAFMALTSGTGVSFISRKATDGPSVNNYSRADAATPFWVKLVKKGTIYTGYTSIDSVSWIQSGDSIDLEFGGDETPIYIGLALTSHNNGVISTATLDNMFYTGAFQYQLQSLEADLNIDKTVTVSWTTTLEASIQHFIVQRKNGDNYINIDTVAAVNEGEFTQNYSYIDLSAPDSGYVYYRLCMVTLEYDIRYSSVASVKIIPDRYPSVYPNPAPQSGSPYLYIARGAQDDPIRFVNIYDIKGRIVMQLTNTNSYPTIEVPVTGISNGLYIVEIITSKTNYKTKVVVKN